MQRPPTAYLAGNTPQKEYGRSAINSYVTNISWDDHVIDIGCGTGETSYYLQQKFNCHLIAVDESEAMIKYVKQKYETDRILAERMDIQDRNLQDSSTYKSNFSYATSFFALHWVSDMECALDNINWLLKPDGRAMLLFPLFYQSYRYPAAIMKTIIGGPRWKKWINVEVLEHVLPKYIMAGIDPAMAKGVPWLTKENVFKEMVLRHGFHVMHYKELLFEFPMTRAVLNGFHPALDLVPEEMREDLLDDMMVAVEQESMNDGHLCQAKEVLKCVMLVPVKTTDLILKQDT